MLLSLKHFSVKSIDSSIFTIDFIEHVLHRNRYVDCLKNLPKRFIFYNGDSLPMGFFFTYYGFFHNRKYSNPHINDLLLVHEFSHFNRFAKKPSRNYVEWSDKMIEDEYDASLDSEMLIYHNCMSYRQHTFNHPILFDNTDFGDRGLSDKKVVEEYRKVRDKAIYKPKGFIEEQISNYQKSNRYWCSLYATTYKELEKFNIKISEMIRNPEVSDDELLAYFKTNIQEIVDYTRIPIEKFAEFYVEVNKTYGNHLYDL